MSITGDVGEDAIVAKGNEPVTADNRPFQFCKTLIEQSTDLYFVIMAADQRFVYINPAIAEILGYSVEEAMSLKPQAMMTAAAMSELCSTLYRGIAEHTAATATIKFKPQHLQLLAKDRKRIPAEIRLVLTVHPDRSIDLITGVIRSDSVWLKSRAEARENEIRYRELFDNMQAGCAVYELTADGIDFIIKDFNRAAERIEKVKRQSVIGKKVSEVFPGVKELGLFDVLRSVARTGKARMHPVSLYKDDRITGWRENFVYRLPSGEIVTVYEDATKRKQREAALEESECRHRALLEAVPDTILQVLPGGEVVYCKAGTGHPLIPQNKVPGFDLLSLPHRDDDRNRLRVYLRQALESGEMQPMEFGFIVDEIERIGEIRIVRETDTMAIVFLRDITERRRTEAEMLKAQRLESIGMLAGGIAHDFNNLLGLIFGQIDMALDTMDPFSDAAQGLQKSMRAFERARDLTSQLLAFSKEKAPAKKCVDVRELVRDSVSLALSGCNAGYSIHVPEKPLFINADPGQISQVINNLLINARQSMPQGGKVTATLSAARNDEIPKTLPAGEYIVLKIEDEGCGIPPDKISRIFDPFYTTKEKGTGLGLAIVYSIITSHGGSISVDSTIGKGTLFSLFLPVGTAADKQNELPPVEYSTQALQGKILIMDDEEILLDIAKQMCKRLDLDADTVRNGQDALQRYNEAFREGHPYDAVLLDMTIAGGMGGIEAAAALRKIDPEVKTIVMSGYSDHEVMADPARYGFRGVMAKPFRIHEFRKTLGEVLREPKTGNG